MDPATGGPTRRADRRMGRPPIDAWIVDAWTDVAIDAPSGGGGSGLDPALEIADPGGQACSISGRAPDSVRPARSAGSSPRRGALRGLLHLQRHRHRVHGDEPVRPPGRLPRRPVHGLLHARTTECGTPADCINVGHATRGVCRR